MSANAVCVVHVCMFANRVLSVCVRMYVCMYFFPVKQAFQGAMYLN